MDGCLHAGFHFILINDPNFKQVRHSLENENENENIFHSLCTNAGQRWWNFTLICILFPNFVVWRTNNECWWCASAAYPAVDGRMRDGHLIYMRVNGSSNGTRRILLIAADCQQITIALSIEAYRCQAIELSKWFSERQTILLRESQPIIEQFATEWKERDVSSWALCTWWLPYRWGPFPATMPRRSHAACARVSTVPPYIRILCIASGVLESAMGEKRKLFCHLRLLFIFNLIILNKHKLCSNFCWENFSSDFVSLFSHFASSHSHANTTQHTAHSTQSERFDLSSSIDFCGWLVRSLCLGRASNLSDPNYF